MPNLFDSISIDGLSVRNRIWVAPMCQYSAIGKDGVPTDWHLVHLASFAVGGAGLILAEATAVSPEARISDQDTGLWNEEQLDAWSGITEFVRAQGAVIGVQLAHAGRKASTWADWGTTKRGSQPPAEGGWQTVAPSAIAFGNYAEPRELASEEIQRIIADFAAAAERAVRAGFQVIEIHAAHGYLLHEFLSPLSNLRTDEWGGSLENRARLLREVLRAIRAAVSVPIFVRFSASDWVDGGWDVEQTATVAEWLKADGAALFDLSSGGLVHDAVIPVAPGYQVPFATRVKELANAPTSAVGVITTPAQAAEIVASGKADAVMLGREMLRDPHFALRAARELGVEIDYWPKQYLRAR